MPLKKCLIANRGEIAVRIIRACHELGMQAVAVYSEADASARHVQLADEAYLIGPPSPALSYLHAEKIIDTAKAAGCDCVHPGYGFMAESAEFAQAVMDAGLVWVGPPPDAIRLMGVKTEARTLMIEADVPVVPGYQPADRVASIDNAAFVEAAEAIGYPVMVKAAGGGGGKGIRVVHQRENLPAALEGARNEAGHAFGDARIFLEKYIEKGRHVEIQVIADSHGNVVHLNERECSSQRRHQKIIEEAPSPLLDAATRQQMGEAAVNAARAVGYVNAGTVEFIATPDAFYFLEMNTRVQVEHPVTELITGIDIVKTQLQVASGEALPFTQDQVMITGHAIECRVYAEDPSNQFLPAIGTVQRFIPPEGPGVRVDSGIQSGDEITIHYDPMIAKVVVHAATRTDAIARMKKALDETIILGTTTNIGFLQSLLQNPVFVAGEVDTRFVDENLASLLPEQTELPVMAIIAAGLSDMMGKGQVVENGGPGDGDIYSPWAKSDHFRIGG